MAGIRQGMTDNQILRLLENIDPDFSGNDSDSEDEQIDDDYQLEYQLPESDDSECEDQNINNDLSNSHIIRAKSGEEWFPQTENVINIPKTAKCNVFKVKAGPTPYAKRYIENENPLSAFRLLFDTKMVKIILTHTIAHGKTVNQDFDLSNQELDSFIGLQYARGILVAKSTPLNDLWSYLYALPNFS